MGHSRWKRIKRSRGYQKAKLFCKRLAGAEPRVHPDLVISTAIELGGWRLDARALDSSSVVYSLGIGEDVRFDAGLIDLLGVVVHAFDPTPSTVAWVQSCGLDPTRFRFHPWAISGHDGTLTLYPRLKRKGETSKVMYTLIAEGEAAGAGVAVPAFTIDSVMCRLGHQRIDLLKMDIEGAEYAVLERMLDRRIVPTQLLVEFHHRFPGIGPEKTVEAIARLKAVGYKMFSISATGREFSFMLEPAS